jgi:hypothetical protein
MTDAGCALALLVVFCVARCASHPGVVVLNDEIDYIDSALVLLERGTLETRSYYGAALIDQAPPLRPPHLPGTALFFAAGYAIAGIDRADITADERLASAPNVLCLFALLFLAVLIVRRETGSRAWGVIAAALVGLQPLLFLFAGISMAELLFAAVGFAALFALLGAEGPVPLWREWLEAAVLVAGILVRPSLVLLLAVWLPLVVRQRGWLGLRVLAWVGLLAFVASPLATGRIRFPGATLSATLGGGPDAVLPNLWANVTRFAQSPSLRYTLQKLALWSTVVAGATTAIVALRDRPLWRGLAWLIAINTIFLLAFYDNMDWRGLRTSSHLLAPSICAIVIGLARSNRRVAIAVVVAMVAAQIAVIAVDQTGRNREVAAAARSWQRRAPGVDALARRVPEGVWLAERGLERARLLHAGPRFVWHRRGESGARLVRWVERLPPDGAIGRGRHLATAAGRLDLVEVDAPGPLRVWVRQL